MDDPRARQAEWTARSVRLEEIAPGTRVLEPNGMMGAVVGVVPEETSAGSGVRVAWADGNRTVVPLRAFSWQGDMLVVGAAPMAANAGAPYDAAPYNVAPYGAPAYDAAPYAAAPTYADPGVQAQRIDGLRSGDTFTVPVIEEHLTADTVWREAGVVRLHVRGEAVPQTVTRETEHEELYVEEVAVGRQLADGEQLAPRQEGDVLIVPIVEEEVVVTIRRVLAREVRITRRTARESRTVDTTTRRTVVELDPGVLKHRVHYPGEHDPNGTR